jgi:anti-anti-sigma factor
LSVNREQNEGHSIVRLEGELNVTSAADLRNLLLEGLGAGKELHLDLERVTEIDITVLQLLWAAGCEAQRTGATIVGRVSEAAAAAAREAGFERFPGIRDSGLTDG